MYSFEKFKNALRKRDEERYNELKKEVKEVKSTIEKLLTMFFECSASKAQTYYSGLEMH